VLGPFKEEETARGSFKHGLANKVFSVTTPLIGSARNGNLEVPVYS
jgi:hypothetical protein